MSRSHSIVSDASVRVTRLLTAILVLGGLVLGPVAHVQGSPAATDTEVSPEAPDPGQPAGPDAHHDCPLCLTLASAAAPMVPVLPGARLLDARDVAAPTAVAGDSGVSDTERARAPPIR